jgi:ribosome-associated translation inhibitor RaiA
MRVQVNTDDHIEGSEGLTSYVVALVEAALGRFGARVTRVEVHLSEQRSHKSHGEDKHCMMEARLADLQPIAVSHRGATLEQAIDSAVERLQRLLDDTVEQRREHRGGAPHGGGQTV